MCLQLVAKKDADYRMILADKRGGKKPKSLENRGSSFVLNEDVEGLRECAKQISTSCIVRIPSPFASITADLYRRTAGTASESHRKL